MEMVNVDCLGIVKETEKAVQIAVDLPSGNYIHHTFGKCVLVWLPKSQCEIEDYEYINGYKETIHQKRVKKVSRYIFNTALKQYQKYIN